MARRRRGRQEERAEERKSKLIRQSDTEERGAVLGLGVKLCSILNRHKLDDGPPIEQNVQIRVSGGVMEKFTGKKMVKSSHKKDLKNSRRTRTCQDFSKKEIQKFKIF